MKEDRKFRKDKKREAKINTNVAIFSPKDDRDWVASAVIAAKPELPTTYLVSGKSPILQQGSIGSCVAHAISTAMAYGEIKSGFTIGNDYSRGYIYANRESGGEGMVVRAALKAVNHSGDCLYPTFPWNETYPSVRKRLLADKEKYDTEAANYKIINYFRCSSEEEIKQALMACGAVILAMPLYTKFGKQTKYPGKDEKVTGSHCMCLIGWDETGWIIQNSWGKLWGDGGKCHVDYDYPVREWWGITINTDIVEPTRPNIFVRLWYKIRSFFEVIKNWIKHLFTK